MKFIAIKTEDGSVKGKLAFYCRILDVSRQGFYQYLTNRNKPWKYQTLVDAMLKIRAEDVCNDTYGRVRMLQALTLKQPEGVHIPSERTVHRVMKEIGLCDAPKRNPNSITKSYCESRKSDNLLKRDFTASEPLQPEHMTVVQLKIMIWRYFISYWNHRRICSANGGLPPLVKRQKYYLSLQGVA